MVMGQHISKRVFLLTDIDFWRGGAGHRVRILELVKFISIHAELSIIYVGVAHELNLEKFEHDFNSKLILLTKKRTVDANRSGELLKELLTSHRFDVGIFEYIHMSFYLQYIPYTIVKMLDLHDIAADRYESFKKLHYEEATYGISEELEYKIFEMYDYVLVLCKPDLARLLPILSPDKLLLCPHPVSVSPKQIRPKVNCIGFVASEYITNKDAIQYFCRECWPMISSVHDVHLNVYGKVASVLDEVSETAYIHVRGWVDSTEEIYNETDIIINPVRMGAGLKIKNIEALANGLPLITTAHGARGLEMGIDEAFLVADNSEDFANGVLRLIRSVDLREKLGRNAARFITQEFSREGCFGTLISKINSI